MKKDDWNRKRTIESYQAEMAEVRYDPRKLVALARQWFEAKSPTARGKAREGAIREIMLLVKALDPEGAVISQAALDARGRK